MRYYRVTWTDNGDVCIRRFEGYDLAKVWKDFLDTCSRSDGAIRDIKLLGSE
jgi:hypothetical protein